jgi:DNA-binding NarL/FixJ family response regulator
MGLLLQADFADTEALMDERRPIEVLLVEDNDVFREALELMLGITPDLNVVGAVGDGRSAVSECDRLRPDVVLMDYRLPELGGVEATAAITACSEAAVVVLTATAEEGELEALMAAGAVSCLTKDSELEEIVRAIRDASLRGASLV